MKKILFVTVVNTVLLFSCTSKKEKTTQHEEVTVHESEACYAYMSGRDTVQLRISLNDHKVIGDLVYNYYGKDKNTGIITGEIKGDTLFGNYEFQSEGITSKRSVVFLVKGNQLIEGYGDVDPATGNPDLKNKSAIKFDSKLVLQKTDCSAQEK